MDEDGQRRWRVAQMLSRLEAELREHERAWMEGEIALPADYFDELAVLKRQDMFAYSQRLAEIMPRLRALYTGR